MNEIYWKWTKYIDNERNILLMNEIYWKLTKYFKMNEVYWKRTNSNFYLTTEKRKQIENNSTYILLLGLLKYSELLIVLKIYVD